MKSALFRCYPSKSLGRSSEPCLLFVLLSFLRSLKRSIRILALSMISPGLMRVCVRLKMPIPPVDLTSVWPSSPFLISTRDTSASRHLPSAFTSAFKPSILSSTIVPSSFTLMSALNVVSTFSFRLPSFSGS